MPYKSLYSRRQSEPNYLPRSWYINDAERLQWVRNIRIKVDEALNKAAVRGYIYRRNVEVIGGIPRFDYTIIIAENLTPEMERFVVIKELMHCYFGPTPDNFQYVTNSGVVLETHARLIFGDSAMSSDSPHVRAEKLALWMAVGVLCPEHMQQKYVGDLAAKTVTLAEIANELRIPRKQAYNLTSAQFYDELANILN